MARLVWHELRLLILLGMLSLGVALCLRYGFDYPIPLNKMSVPGRMQRALRYGAVLGLLTLALHLVRHWWAIPRASRQSGPALAGWRVAWAALWEDAFASRLVLSAATVLLMVALFSIFAMWKASIAVLSPWRWDATLLVVERAVHGGVLPQDVTRHWFGSGATIFLDRMYAFWLRVVPLFIVWQAFRPPSRSRTRALLALALAYTLLGNVGAVLMSSGGPVYYGRLVGQPSPYDQHAAYLAGIPGLHATAMHQAIWDWLQTHTYVPFGSISAMPSMHVAATTIMALACWERHRWFGVIGWLYVALILAGSVHLNWHYAIDGYVAIIGASAVWLLSGALVQRYG